MKFKITFKDPDGVYDQIAEFLCFEGGKNIDNNQLKEKLKRWVEYGEYITVEFDLDLMTAKVLTVEESNL